MVQDMIILVEVYCNRSVQVFVSYIIPMLHGPGPQALARLANVLFAAFGTLDQIYNIFGGAVNVALGVVDL